MLGAHLVTLVWEILETLRSGAYLEEVGMLFLSASHHTLCLLVRHDVKSTYDTFLPP